MKTDDLIGQLAQALRPVRPLAPPRARVWLWLLSAAAYVAVGVGMVAAGVAPGGASAEPIYVLQQILALLTGGVAALAAFTSVIPGLRRHAAVLAAVSAFAWLGVVLWGCVRDLQAHGTLGLGGQTDWPCVAAMVVGGGALWAVMIPMLRRGVAMTPRLTALLGGAAALGIANVVACLAQPHQFNGVVLLWHGGTIALMLAFFVTAGPGLMRWPVPSRS